MESTKDLLVFRIQEAKLSKLEFAFEGLEDYYHLVNNKINTDLNILFEKHKSETSKVDVSDDIRRCEVDDFYAEVFFEIKDKIIKNFHYSFIMLMYSFLERAMLDLCIYIKQKNNYKIELNDLKDEGIIKAKTYLEKVCDIAFPESSSEWQNIFKFNNIRNCLVHADGNVEKATSSEKIKNIVTNTKYVSLENDKYIIFESEYLNGILQHIKNFIFSLYKNNSSKF
jgi:hypothetical protein